MSTNGKMMTAAIGKMKSKLITFARPNPMVYSLIFFFSDSIVFSIILIFNLLPTAGADLQSVPFTPAGARFYRVPVIYICFCYKTLLLF
jgi:hypothetical protein